MKIERTCPHCKTRVYAHIVNYDVPAAFGKNSPAAVLAQCPEGPAYCGKQWRAVLREDERQEMEAEKLAAAEANMIRPEGWYWILDSFDVWEPMYYSAKGWRGLGTVWFTDDEVGEIGPAIPLPPEHKR